MVLNANNAILSDIGDFGIQTKIQVSNKIDLVLLVSGKNKNFLGHGCRMTVCFLTETGFYNVISFTILIEIRLNNIFWI